MAPGIFLRHGRPLAFAGLAALLLAGCGSEAPERAPQAAATSGEARKLALAMVPDMKPLSAEITTRDLAEARARINGTLVALDVRAGDMVRKGQRIGLVTDARLGFEASAMAAQVGAADAERARAEAELARVQYLYDNKVYAKARLEQAQAMARAAGAQARAAGAQAQASASMGAQGAIFAPAAGRVLRADVPAGSVVAAGMPVASITAGPLILKLALPETLAGTVRAGSAVTLQEPGGSSRQGAITQVYPAVSGGVLRADATMPGLSADLIGKRVSVLVAVGERPALVVPRRFITTRFGMDYVTLRQRDGTTASVTVQTAQLADAGSVEILSGVGAGDTLLATATPGAPPSASR